MGMKLPSWIVCWFVISIIICTIDALFVLLRPRTLPGGDLNYLVKPYNIYITVDQRYKDLKDDFLLGVAWMNLFEVAIKICALLLHHSSSSWSQLTSFMVSTMTWSKTMLFLLLSTPCCHGGHDYHAGVSWQKLVLIYIIPNGIWIVLPFACMVSLGKRLVQPSQGKQTGKKD